MRVLKIGGNELADDQFLTGLAQFVASQAEPMVLVHGGGQAIAEMQNKLGLSPVKVDGLRVTDGASMQVVQMVLSGYTNKLLVTALLKAGVSAVGLSGVDGSILQCRKKWHESVDLGLVGEIKTVNTQPLQLLLEAGLTAVLSPISLGPDHTPYNVNADEAATAVASALQAKQLDFVSNVAGVLQNKQPIPNLTPDQAETLIQDGVIHGGMIPKVKAALTAVAQGIPQTRIVNLAGLPNNGGTLFQR